MRKQFLLGAALVSATCLLLISSAQTQNPSTTTTQKENPMATHASGTFDVKVLPQTATDFETSTGLSRYSLDKQISGDLEGTSKGEMLTASGGEVKGFASYVALERITGKLNGRTGTFLLQHNAYMTATTQQMNITVVPDSATGELIGLTGKFIIKIVDKKHFYEFDYNLPGDN